MTVLEIAKEVQSTACALASMSIRDIDTQGTPAEVKYAESRMRHDIDKAYVLGLIIDDMAVELAEKEI
jgi:hypothetical protein